MATDQARLIGHVELQLSLTPCHVPSYSMRGAIGKGTMLFLTLASRLTVHLAESSHSEIS